MSSSHWVNYLKYFPLESQPSEFRKAILSLVKKDNFTLLGKREDVLDERVDHNLNIYSLSYSRKLMTLMNIYFEK